MGRWGGGGVAVNDFQKLSVCAYFTSHATSQPPFPTVWAKVVVKL